MTTKLVKPFVRPIVVHFIVGGRVVGGRVVGGRVVVGCTTKLVKLSSRFRYIDGFMINRRRNQSSSTSSSVAALSVTASVVVGATVVITSADFFFEWMTEKTSENTLLHRAPISKSDYLYHIPFRLSSPFLCSRPSEQTG